MSSNWNVPAQAKPNYEGSEPSIAMALQYPSWKWVTILTICMSKNSDFGLYHDYNTFFVQFHEYKRIRIFGVEHYDLGT